MFFSTFYLYLLLNFVISYAQLEDTSFNEANKEDRCNFIDSKVQPNTFRFLSKTIPPKLEGLTKYDAGKIGIIGGSAGYSGAPFFSGMSALKVGADIVYIITAESEAPVIKSYSPDLIVFPYLDAKHASKIRALLLRMDLVVIGPGAGREEENMRLVYDIIEDCKTLNKPLVIDADGLVAISKKPNVLQNYPCPGVIMTPNQREANYLMAAVTNATNTSSWYSYWGDCVSILLKGENDNFYSNAPSYHWSATGGGSPRRAAGQGDILAGALGTFYNWALKSDLCKNENNTLLAQSVASYAAAKLTRLCNNKAYADYGRSMTASDMIRVMHSAFDTMFSEA